jgi:hypothetical protein
MTSVSPHLDNRHHSHFDIMPDRWFVLSDLRLWLLVLMSYAAALIVKLPS